MTRCRSPAVPIRGIERNRRPPRLSLPERWSESEPSRDRRARRRSRTRTWCRPLRLRRTCCPSNRAKLDGLLERRHRIPHGYELVRDEAIEFQIGDGLCDGAPVQLLRIIELMPAGHAARVEMADVLDILLNRADDVSLHDLHVVDVVEQFYSG